MSTEKRVCTITHHTVPNYGAVLQTYALQQAIKSLGYETEVLNYDEERVRRSYHYSIFAQKSCKEILKHVVYHKRYKNKIAVFQKFLAENVSLSKRYTKKNISKSNLQYDLFISGSDQVWSLGLHQGDKSYLLDFVDDCNKKGSYAASFGYATINDIPEQYHQDYASLLNDFTYVNIREKEGLDIFRRFVAQGKDCAQVIDPTFLISTEKWHSISKKPAESNYILLYCVNRYNELLEYAKSVAEKTGKKIINIQDGNQQLPGVINRESISVNEFLGYIENADLVLTNSFHGIAFSIIFRKEFVFDYVHKKVNSNSRVRSLTEVLSLQERELAKVDMDKVIPYSDVETLLTKEIEYSYNRLASMLQGRK